MPETFTIARVPLQVARELGRRAAVCGGGNPFDWTTERRLHDAWARSYVAARRVAA